ETRILHAAANLARLKIRASRDQARLPAALGIAAREMGCERIELHRADQVFAWSDLHAIDVADSFDAGDEGAAAAPEGPRVFDLPIDDSSKLVFSFSRQAALTPERSQILEELARDVGERLQ
ncbi:MAG TPA: hypothetical protein VNT79_02690, partial [Phycisphaerae bacterium]|nr:hypothetical protein [Phycisphaerae bacterium]